MASEGRRGLALDQLYASLIKMAPEHKSGAIFIFDASLERFSETSSCMVMAQS